MKTLVARQRIASCALAVLLGTTPALVLAQSQITVKVETANGAMVSNVTVKARLLDPKSKATVEVVDGRAIGTNTYQVERLRKGLYEFYACDDGLAYEPSVSSEVHLGENDSKTIPTLVLGEQQSREVSFQGINPGTKVCLIHRQTGCQATRTMGKARDGSGGLSIRGIQEHFDVSLQACKEN